MFRFFLIFSFISVGSTLALPSKKEWTLVQNFQGASLYRLSRSSEVRGVYSSRKSPKPADWSRVSSVDIFKKWEKPKQKMFEAMGITQWKVEDYNWSKEDEVTYKLTAEGSYVGKDESKVFFHETHFYTRDESFQILLTGPEKKALSQELIAGFVEGAKKEWVKEKSS